MRYAAFLRAVNVGKHNRLRMQDLRQLMESIGLWQVSSYLQSGNLVFEADALPQDIAQGIEAAMPKLGCKDVLAMVRTADQMQKIADLKPFPANDTSLQFVSFLRRPSSNPLPAPRPGMELLHSTGTEVFWTLDRSISSASSPHALIETRLEVPATARYWKVVQAVYELLQSHKFDTA